MKVDCFKIFGFSLDEKIIQIAENKIKKLKAYKELTEQVIAIYDEIHDALPEDKKNLIDGYYQHREALSCLEDKVYYKTGITEGIAIARMVCTRNFSVKKSNISYSDLFEI